MLDNIAFGIIIVIIFLSLIVLFTVLVVKLHINKVTNYTRLIYQKDIEFQKTLNTAIVETQEQVLTNISQDLHDDAGQQLTYINFQLENLKLDSPDLAMVLSPISESVSGLSESIRRISHALNNQLISQQDLLKAIKSEADRLSQSGKLTVTLSIEDSRATSFGKNEQIVIYRIFQEIVNNILKHSAADTITIQIATNPVFHMTVRDNGKGFSIDNTNEQTLTMGLHSMKRRAEMIDYTVSVTSEIGNGTTVSVSQKN